MEPSCLSKPSYGKSSKWRAKLDLARYQINFANSFKNTRRLRLSVPPVGTNEVLTEEQLGMARERQSELLSFFGPERLCGYCASVHATQKRLIQRDSNANAVLTIGWVSTGNTRIWETSFKKIEREINRNGKVSRTEPFDMHVWLTISDGDNVQILDFVLPCYLYSKGYDISPELLVIDSRDCAEWAELEFHPLMVGQHVLEALNFLEKGWSPTKSGKPE